MSAAALAEDISNRQFVQKRVDSAVQVAKNLYNRVEGSSPAVKAGLERIERSTEWLSRPIVNKIAQVSGPVLQTVDNGLTKVYSTIEGNIVKPASDKLHSGNQSLTEARQYVVESAWFQKVQATLHSVPRSSIDLKKFYETAYASFKPSENYGAFVASLQQKLGNLWDDRLKGPAQTFHTKASELWGKVDTERRNPQELYASLRLVLEESWEKSYIATNVRSLYNAAIEHYKTNVATSGANAQQLLQSFKEKAGAAWHDNLSQPLLELFKKAAAVPANLLHKIDPNDEIPGVTLNDVFRSAQSFAKSRWSAGLHTAEKAVDYLLPSPATDSKEEHDVTVSSLVRSTLKRLRSRVETSGSSVLVAVRTFSTQKVEPTLHVDPVKYSEDLVHVTHSQIFAPIYSNVTQRCSVAVASGKKLLSGVVSTVQPKVQAVSTQAHDAVYSVVAIIRPRLPLSAPHIDALKRYVQARSDATKSNVSRLVTKSKGLTTQIISIVGSVPLRQAPIELKRLFLQTLHPSQRSERFQQFASDVLSWAHCWVDLVLLHTPVEGSSPVHRGSVADDGVELKAASASLLGTPTGTASPAPTHANSPSVPSAANPAQSGEPDLDLTAETRPAGQATDAHKSKPHKARYTAKHAKPTATQE